MARREQVVSSVQINRPPGEVFAYLTDVARHAEWSPKGYRVEGIAPGEHVAQGSRFVSYGWLPNDKDHRNEVEATEVLAPSRLVLTSTEPGGEQFVNTFSLSGSGAGTTVERVMDMPRPGGAVGVVFPLIAKFLVKPDVTKGLGKLKVAAEASGSEK
ncbi:MAG: SRPBCC family protein [Actinomycetes bacterium]